MGRSRPPCGLLPLSLALVTIAWTFPLATAMTTTTNVHASPSSISVPSRANNDHSRIGDIGEACHAKGGTVFATECVPLSTLSHRLWSRHRYIQLKEEVCGGKVSINLVKDKSLLAYVVDSADVATAYSNNAIPFSQVDSVYGRFCCKDGKVVREYNHGLQQVMLCQNGHQQRAWRRMGLAATPPARAKDNVIHKAVLVAGKDSQQDDELLSNGQYTHGEVFVLDVLKIYSALLHNGYTHDDIILFVPDWQVKFSQLCDGCEPDYEGSFASYPYLKKVLEGDPNPCGDYEGLLCNGNSLPRGSNIRVFLFFSDHGARDLVDGRVTQTYVMLNDYASELNFTAKDEPTRKELMRSLASPDTDPRRLKQMEADGAITDVSWQPLQTTMSAHEFYAIIENMEFESMCVVIDACYSAGMFVPHFEPLSDDIAEEVSQYHTRSDRQFFKLDAVDIERRHSQPVSDKRVIAFSAALSPYESTSRFGLCADEPNPRNCGAFFNAFYQCLLEYSQTDLRSFYKCLIYHRNKDSYDTGTYKFDDYDPRVWGHPLLLEMSLLDFMSTSSSIGESDSNPNGPLPQFDTSSVLGKTVATIGNLIPVRVAPSLHEDDSGDAVAGEGGEYFEPHRPAPALPLSPDNE